MADRGVVAAPQTAVFVPEATPPIAREAPCQRLPRNLPRPRRRLPSPARIKSRSCRGRWDMTRVGKRRATEGRADGGLDRLRWRSRQGLPRRFPAPCGRRRRRTPPCARGHPRRLCLGCRCRHPGGHRLPGTRLGGRPARRPTDRSRCTPDHRSRLGRCRAALRPPDRRREGWRTRMT
jgi:hypothetical protein